MIVVNDLGTSVDGTALEENRAQQVVDEITAGGGQAVVSHADVRTQAGADSVIAAALNAFGHLDIVINNAGIINYSAFPDTSLEDFERHLSVHLTGSFNVAKAAWPQLVEHAYGRIVMTASPGIFGFAHIVPYGSAKAGVVGLARALAAAGAAHGISVNAIAPVAFTRMSLSRLGPMSEAARLERSRSSPTGIVSSMVAALAHDSCPVSGELYFAGSARVARIFWAETAGIRGEDLTAEGIAASWDAINSEAIYRPRPVEPDRAMPFFDRQGQPAMTDAFTSPASKTSD